MNQGADTGWSSFSLTLRVHATPWNWLSSALLSDPMSDRACRCQLHHPRHNHDIHQQCDPLCADLFRCEMRNGLTPPTSPA